MMRSADTWLATVCVIGLTLWTTPARTAEMGWLGVGVRLGYTQPKLKAANVPFVGSKLQDTFDKTNRSIDDYNTAHGTTRPHYVMGDLNLDSGMLQITPSLHLGGDGYFTKLELPIGLSSELKTIGFGCYPINYGWEFSELGLFPYASVGFVLSYATSSEFQPTGGSVIKVDAKGGMAEARLAVGLKYFAIDSWPVSFEVGYSPYAVGLVYDGSHPLNVGSLNTLPENPGATARGGSGWVLNALIGIDWL
jgi:hypothetical protein